VQNEITFFKKRAEIFLAGIKEQLDEGDGRILLGDNTGGGTVMLRPITFQRVEVWAPTRLSCIRPIRTFDSA
jgi:hypothetical protein